MQTIRQVSKVAVRNSDRVMAKTGLPKDPLCRPYLEHSYSLMYANAFCFKALSPVPMVLFERPQAFLHYTMDVFRSFSSCVFLNVPFDLAKCEYNVGTG